MMAKKTAKKKTTKKSGKKKTGKKKAAAKTQAASSGGTLGRASYEQLQAELARRDKDVKRLERRREKLHRELAEIDAELASYGALSATGGIRKRPKNEKSLVETLKDVLKNKTMGVSEAAQAARDAGYMTTANNFRTIVNQTLIRENKDFKKVERGRYTAR